MLKLSNKTFYKRHNNEIAKFIYRKESLHIINKKSKNKLINEDCEILFLDLNDSKLTSLSTINKKYQRIILTDVVENYDDVFALLNIVSNLLTIDGKLIISSINTKYLILSRTLEFLKLKDSNENTSYIHVKKIRNITSGVGLEYQKFYTKQLFPFSFFYVGNVINKIMEIISFQLNLGIKTYIIFRPAIITNSKNSKSIIIPAKNEEGNLVELVSRIPKFENTEIIFSYGKSKDNTLKVMKQITQSNKLFKFKLVKQTKNGKANAVWEALNVVENDLIAILDADISVDPETLSDFFDIIEKNNADFVNGTRLIYDMEKNSMRFLNRIGNRFFQFFISKIIKEALTDSLCGTKVFKKSYLNDLYFWQNIFGKKDPFGDFDLIFAAAYSGQKIVEMPIVYRERKYGTTQIARFKDGFKLLFYLTASFSAFNTSINEVKEQK